MAVNGIALAAVSAGAIFLYSAIENKGVLASLKSVISGKGLATSPGSSGAVTAPAGTGITPAGTPAGGYYNTAQLQSLWVMAGGSQAAKVNAACHAMQESGGDPLVTSPNPDGGTNVGLWQLDTPGGEGAGYTVAELQVPLTNARVTVERTSDGANWSAWATPGC
jgi:hypothetical protein